MATDDRPRVSRSRRWHARLHEQRALSIASEAACRLADEPGPPPRPPIRMDEDYRLAQIGHAVAVGMQPWEIAQLVPAPATPAERARVTA